MVDTSKTLTIGGSCKTEKRRNTRSERKMRTRDNIYFYFTDRVFFGRLDKWTFGHFFGAMFFAMMVAFYSCEYVASFCWTVALGIGWEMMDYWETGAFDPPFDRRGFDVMDVIVDTLGALTGCWLISITSVSYS